MANISRRGFLTGLLAAVPAIVIGEELADMLAPRKLISLPPRPVLVQGLIGRYTGIEFLHTVDIESVIRKQIGRDLARGTDEQFWKDQVERANQSGGLTPEKIREAKRILAQEAPVLWGDYWPTSVAGGLGI